MITRSNLLDHWLDAMASRPAATTRSASSPIIAYDLIDTAPVVTAPRASRAARRPSGWRARASSGCRSSRPTTPAGSSASSSIGDLLKARQHIVEEEAKRERFFGNDGPDGESIRREAP